MATWLYQIDQENWSPQRYRRYARIAKAVADHFWALQSQPRDQWSWEGRYPT
jgi:hypothetical protein